MVDSEDLIYTHLKEAKHMLIIAILGRSGSGKSTLETAFEKVGFNRIISYTTRPIRSGEENHREYHFISPEQFKNLVDTGIIIEQAEFNGYLYGAPKPIGSERNVIVVESDGLVALKNLYNTQVFSVYVDTPLEEIEARLHHRNNTIDIESRFLTDNKKFEDIHSKVDFVVNGLNAPSTNISIIMSELVRRNIT